MPRVNIFAPPGGTSLFPKPPGSHPLFNKVNAPGSMMQGQPSMHPLGKSTALGASLPSSPKPGEAVSPAQQALMARSPLMSQQREAEAEMQAEMQKEVEKGMKEMSTNKTQKPEPATPKQRLSHALRMHRLGGGKVAGAAYFTPFSDNTSALFKTAVGAPLVKRTTRPKKMPGGAAPDSPALDTAKMFPGTKIIDSVSGGIKSLWSRAKAVPSAVNNAARQTAKKVVDHPYVRPRYDKVKPIVTSKPAQATYTFAKDTIKGFGAGMPIYGAEGAYNATIGQNEMSSIGENALTYANAGDFAARLGLAFAPKRYRDRYMHYRNKLLDANSKVPGTRLPSAIGYSRFLNETAEGMGLTNVNAFDPVGTRMRTLADSNVLTMQDVENIDRLNSDKDYYRYPKELLKEKDYRKRLNPGFVASLRKLNPEYFAAKDQGYDITPGNDDPYANMAEWTQSVMDAMRQHGYRSNPSGFFQALQQMPEDQIYSDQSQIPYQGSQQYYDELPTVDRDNLVSRLNELGESMYSNFSTNDQPDNVFEPAPPFIPEAEPTPQTYTPLPVPESNYYQREYTQEEKNDAAARLRQRLRSAGR